MKIQTFPEVPLDKFVVLTKKEAVHLIAYLAAQLGETTGPGMQSGSCFEAVVNEPYARYHFSVSREIKD